MRPHILFVSVALAAMSSACGANGQDPAPAGQPLETRPANGAGQTPAFEARRGRRACAARSP